MSDPLDLLDDGLLLDDRKGPVPEGFCHLCGARAGRVPCRACGKATCASDLWTMFALCRGCVPEEQMARWHLRGEVEAENWLAGGQAPNGTKAGKGGAAEPAAGAAQAASEATA